MFDSGHYHASDSLAPFPINMSNNPWPILPIPTNRSANALCPPPHVASSLLAHHSPFFRHYCGGNSSPTSVIYATSKPEPRPTSVVVICLPELLARRRRLSTPFAIRKRLLVRLPTLSKASRFRSTSMLSTPTMAPLVVTSRGLHLHFPRLISSDLPFQRLPD